MNGDITIKHTDWAWSALERVASYIEFTGLDAAGTATTKTQKMTDADQLVSSSIGNVQKAIDNFISKELLLAASSAKLLRKLMLSVHEKLAIDRDVSRLGDADLATLITDLQSQLTNLNAAQAAFAQIGQQSLFDFIR